MNARLKNALMTGGGVLCVLAYVAFVFALGMIGPVLCGAFMFWLVLFMIYYLVTPPDAGKLKKFSLQHKISLCISAAATVAIGSAVLVFKMTDWEIPHVFYILFRALVFAAMTSLLLFKLKPWFCVLLVAGAVVFNPFFPIYFTSFLKWGLCAMAAMSLMGVAWTVIIWGKTINL